MIKQRARLFFLFALTAWCLVPIQARAQVDLDAQIREQLDTTGGSAQVRAVDPRQGAAAIVQILLSLLGTIFLVLMIMSGYWLMTARGNEEKVEKAKDTIRAAVVGLLLVMAAYAITIFVTSRLQEVVGYFLPTPVHAAETASVEDQMSAFAGSQGANFGNPTDPRLVMANIIRAFLTVLGTLFVAYTVYAGYMIMTSAGEEEKVKKGKDTLRNAVIGMLITLSAYAITTFVANALRQATNEEGFEAGIEIEQNGIPRSRDPFDSDLPFRP